MKLFFLFVVVFAICQAAEGDRIRGDNAEQGILSRRELKGSKGSDSDDSGKKGKGGKRDSRDDRDDKCYGTVVVANKDSGTLSILDANDGDLMETVDIPYDPQTMSRPEPNDVETVNGIIYVSDTANDRLVAFDGVSYDVVAIIQVGDAPSELTSDARGSQLWVANTADNTVMIVDLAFNVVLRVIEAFDPAGTVDFGNNVVNDVLLSPSGDAGFVTYAGGGGLIVRFGADGQIQTSNAGIGDNARVASSFRFNCLYVPSTAGDVLDILFNLDLNIDQSLNINDPFDAVSSVDGQFIYITSTANNAIYTFDVGSNELLASVVTTTLAGPTKMTHTGDRLFVAHGALNRVSVFAVSNGNPIPIEIANIDGVGLNPFGISFCEPTRVCSSRFSQS